jgi:hypothetical protein
MTTTLRNCGIYPVSGVGNNQPSPGVLAVARVLKSAKLVGRFGGGADVL